ncbi:MAG: hypothetical protein ABFD92_03870 [Planctomycetaceae bacterium]|nr:hypothetical protein [Planctomycetaceae bacterium]
MPNTCRPWVIDHFIAPKAILEPCRHYLEANWKFGKAFPNTLILGGSGVGKHTLCSVLLRELGCQPMIFHSSSLETPEDLMRAFLRAGGGRGAIGIEYIEYLGCLAAPALMEAFYVGSLVPRYPALEEPVKLPATVFATALDYRHVPPALRDCFGLVLKLHPPDGDALAQVLAQVCQRAGGKVHTRIARRLSKWSLSRSNDDPRLALAAIEEAADLARLEVSSDAHKKVRVLSRHFDKAVRLLESADAREEKDSLTRARSSCND